MVIATAVCFLLKYNLTGQTEIQNTCQLLQFANLLRKIIWVFETTHISYH